MPVCVRLRNQAPVHFFLFLHNGVLSIYGQEWLSQCKRWKRNIKWGCNMAIYHNICRRVVIVCLLFRQTNNSSNSNNKNKSALKVYVVLYQKQGRIVHTWRSLSSSIVGGTATTVVVMVIYMVSDVAYSLLGKHICMVHIVQQLQLVAVAVLLLLFICEGLHVVLLSE